MFAFPSIFKYSLVGLIPSRVRVEGFLWQSNSNVSAGVGCGGKSTMVVGSLRRIWAKERGKRSTNTLAHTFSCI